MEKLTVNEFGARRGVKTVGAWLMVMMVSLLTACSMEQKAAIIVEDAMGRGYYIHGDTLETDNAPASCAPFVEAAMPPFADHKWVLRTYSFFACRDSDFAGYGGIDCARQNTYNSKQKLTTHNSPSGIVYACIADARIKMQRGIHVGMARGEVMRRMGLPSVGRAVNHIIFKMDAVVGDVVYRFDFDDDTLTRIRVQTSDKNYLAWNPAPYFAFVEPELTRSDHGPKIYAHGRDSLQWFSPVCYLNARGDTIVPFSRGYTYQYWPKIGRLGLVHRSAGKDYIAINYRGEELFHVFGLLDGSPDFIGDGLFRIVGGADNKIGYADTLGNVVIAPQFAYGTPFRYGRAKVANTGHWDKSNPEMPEWKSHDWFYIDQTGRRVEQKCESRKAEARR